MFNVRCLPCQSQYKDDNSSPASEFIKQVVMADFSHVQLKMRDGPQKIALDVTPYQVEVAFHASRACSELCKLGANIARPYHVENRPATAGTQLIQSKFPLVMEDFSSEKG